MKVLIKMRSVCLQRLGRTDRLKSFSWSKYYPRLSEGYQKIVQQSVVIYKPIGESNQFLKINLLAFQLCYHKEVKENISALVVKDLGTRLKI